MQYTEIAERLKTLRKELKLSQTDFGRKIGKNYHSVMRWELGKVYPPTNVLSHICDTFKVRLGWLESGEGEIFSSSDARSAAEDQTVKYKPEENGNTFITDIPDNAVFISAAGSSSPPVSEGDVLIYIPVRHPDSSSLYLVEDIYGDTHARWFSKDYQRWLSKRPDYPDLEFNKAICFGKVIKIIRQIKF